MPISRVNSRPLAMIRASTTSLRTTNFPPPGPLADDAGGRPAVHQAAQGAAQSAADQGDQQRFQQEGDEDLAAVIAQQAEHSDVGGPLADGGQHGVHDAEDAADGHDGGHHDDAVEELLAGAAQGGEVIGLDLGLHGGPLVAVGEVVLELHRRGGTLRADDHRGIGFLAEHGADHAALGPDFGVESRAGRLHHAHHQPRPESNSKRSPTSSRWGLRAAAA